VESFSGHADSDEILRWLRTFREAPKQTFIVHGEPDSSRALEAEIRRSLGWKTRIPKCLETVDLF
jgi:metallo-beta-lactamase family protein